MLDHHPFPRYLPYKKAPILYIVHLFMQDPHSTPNKMFIVQEEVAPSFVLVLLGTSVKSSRFPP